MPAIYYRNPNRFELAEIEETNKLDSRLKQLGLDFQSNPTRVSDVHNYLERDAWMDPSLLAGMSLAALQNPLISLKRNNPAMQNIVDAWEEYTEEQSNLLGRMIKGGIRTAFVAMDSAAEKLIKRPIQSSGAVMINEDIPMEFALLELIPNLGFAAAKFTGNAPDTTFNEFRAKREAKKEELGPTQFSTAFKKLIDGEEVNLGTGFFGDSLLAEDTELYKRIAANTTNSQELENARMFIQQQLGDPITVNERNRVNANTYTFADGTARPISPGLVAMHRVADSADDRGYKVASGIVDGIFTLGLDPANVLGAYWAKVRKLRRAFNPDTVKKGLMGNMAKRFVNFPSVEEYLNSPVVRELAEVGAKSQDIAVQKNLVKNQIRYGDDAADILLEMTAAQTADEWIEAVRKYGTRFEHKFEKYSKRWRKIGDDQWQPKKWKQRNKVQVDMHKYEVANGGRKAKFLELRRDLRNSKVSRDMWDMPQTSLSAVEISEAPFILDEWLEFFNAPPEFRRAYFQAINRIKKDYQNRLRLATAVEEGVITDEILETFGAHGIPTTAGLSRPPSLATVKDDIMKLIDDGKNGEVSGIGWNVTDDLGNTVAHKDTLMSFFDKKYATGQGLPEVGTLLIRKAIANTNEMKRAYKLDPKGKMQVNVAAVFADGGDALVDGVSSGRFEALHSATTLAEYMAHSISLPDPRELGRYIGNVRNAFRSLASWDMLLSGPKRGITKRVPIDKVSVPIKGSPVAEDEVISLIERAHQSIQRGYKYNIKEEGIADSVMMRYLNSYMSKIWKPFALLRFAWTLRVVGEEQVRMWTEGLDSMFNHPISYFSYWVGDNAPMKALNGNMNNALRWKQAMSKGHGGYVGINNFGRNREYKVIGRGDKRHPSGWANETFLDNSDELTREIDEVVMAEINKYDAITPDDPNVVYIVEGEDKGSTLAGNMEYLGDSIPLGNLLRDKTLGHVIADLRHGKVSADKNVADFIADIVETNFVSQTQIGYEGYLDISKLKGLIITKTQKLTMDQLEMYGRKEVGMTANRLRTKALSAVDEYWVANSPINKKVPSIKYKQESLDKVIEGKRTVIHSLGGDTRVSPGKLIGFMDKKSRTIKYFRVVEVKSVNLLSKGKPSQKNIIRLESAQEYLVENGYGRAEANNILHNIRSKVEKLTEKEIEILNKHEDLLNNFIAKRRMSFGFAERKAEGYSVSKIRGAIKREKEIKIALEDPEVGTKELTKLNKEMKAIDRIFKQEGELTPRLKHHLEVTEDKVQLLKNKKRMQKDMEEALSTSGEGFDLDAVEADMLAKIKETDAFIDESEKILKALELEIELTATGRTEVLTVQKDTYRTVGGRLNDMDVTVSHDVPPVFMYKTLQTTRNELENILRFSFGRKLDSKGIPSRKGKVSSPLWRLKKMSAEDLAKAKAAGTKVSVNEVILLRPGQLLIDMGIYKNEKELITADYNKIVRAIRKVDEEINILKKAYKLEETDLSPKKLQRHIKTTDEIIPVAFREQPEGAKELEYMRQELQALQGKIDIPGTQLSMLKLEPVTDETLDLTRINGRKKAQLIISGGQTGVDVGALAAAQRMQYRTGGKAPKEFITDDGYDFSLQNDFGLTEDIDAFSPEDLSNKIVELVNGRRVKTTKSWNNQKIGWVEKEITVEGKLVKRKVLVYKHEDAIPKGMKDKRKVGDEITGVEPEELQLLKGIYMRSRAIKNVDNADVQIIITSPRFGSRMGIKKGKTAITKSSSQGTASTFNYATTGRWGLPRSRDIGFGNNPNQVQELLWITEPHVVSAAEQPHIFYSKNKLGDWDPTVPNVRTSEYKDTIVINLDKYVADGGLDEETMMLIDNVLASYQNPVVNISGPREQLVMGRLAKEPMKEVGFEGGTILGWSRYGDPGVETLEVSTKGDSFGKQFSAFNAKFADGESVELKWAKRKGYKSIKEAKGKEAIHPDFPYYEEYLKIWNDWVDDSPKNLELLEQLSEKARGMQLTDNYATTDNNQARALSDIINQRFGPEMYPDDFVDVPLNIQGMEAKLAFKKHEAKEWLNHWRNIEKDNGIKLIRGIQYRVMDKQRQLKSDAHFENLMKYETNVTKDVSQATGLSDSYSVTIAYGHKRVERKPKELARLKQIQQDYLKEEKKFWGILDEIDSLEHSILRGSSPSIPKGEISRASVRSSGPNRRLQEVTEEIVTDVFEPDKSWGGLQGEEELVKRGAGGNLRGYFEELAEDSFLQAKGVKQHIVGNETMIRSYLRSRIADRHRLAGGEYDVYIKHPDKPDFAYKLPTVKRSLKDVQDPKFEHELKNAKDKITLDIDGVVNEYENLEELLRLNKDRFYEQVTDDISGIPSRLIGADDNTQYGSMLEMFEAGYYLDYDITMTGDPELLSVFAGRRPFQWEGRSIYVGEDMSQYERKLFISYLTSKSRRGFGPNKVKISKRPGEIEGMTNKWDAWVEDMFDGFMSAKTNKFSRSPAFMQYYTDWFIQNARFMPMQVKEQIVSNFERAWQVVAKENIDVSLARRIVNGAKDIKGNRKKAWVDKTLSELKVDMELGKVGDGIDIDSIPAISRFKQDIKFESTQTISGEAQTSMDMIVNGERTSFTTLLPENKIPKNGDIILLEADGVQIPVQVTRVTPYRHIKTDMSGFLKWSEDEGLKLDWAADGGIEDLYKEYEKIIDLKRPKRSLSIVTTEKSGETVNVFRGGVKGHGLKWGFGNPFFHEKEKLADAYRYLFPLQTSSYEETVRLYKRWLYGGRLYDDAGKSNLLGESIPGGRDKGPTLSFPWFKNGSWIDDARKQPRPHPKNDDWEEVSKILEEERKKILDLIDKGFFDDTDIFYKRGFKDPEGKQSHADVLQEFIKERRPDAFKKEVSPPSIFSDKEMTTIKFRYYSGKTFTTFEEADELAKAYALTQTKNLLYDLNRRGQTLDALRLVFPFGEAYKEILTTQARLLSQNPHKARRASIVIDSMQDDSMFGADPDHNDSFFAEDPVTGEQMYNFADPGGVFSGWVIGADPEDVGVRAGLRGYTRNLNMMATTIMPGVGPVVQIPASLFNVSEFGFVADQLFPFGRPEVRHGIAGVLDIPKAFAAATIPPYMKKLFAALNPLQTGIPDPADQFSPETSKDMVGILASTTKDLLKARTYAGTVDVSTRQGQRLAVKEAVSDARWLSLIRGSVQWVWFTGGEVRYEQAITDEGLLFMDPGAVTDLDPDARFTGFANLVGAYYKLYSEAQELIKNNPEYADTDPQYLATKNFEILYGSNPMPLLIRKTREITEYPMGDTGLEWARENPALFAEYPNTAVFGKPYDEFEEFDVRAWRESITKGARIGLTPNDWLHLLNQANGRMSYQNIKHSVKNNPEFAVMNPMARQHLLAESKLFIMAMFPGFGQELTMRKPADLETKIAELRRWEDEPILANSDAGQALKKYFALRDAMLEQYRLQTGRPMSTLEGKSAIVIRNKLRVLAKMLINQYPEFRYVYNGILSRELEEDIRSVPEGFAIQGI